jgi:hypothetical protein
LSERDTRRAVVGTQHALLAETLLVGGTNGLSRSAAHSRRLIPNQHQPRALARQRAVTAAPLPAGLKDAQAIRKPRRNFAIEKSAPVLISNSWTVAARAPEHQLQP